MKQLIFDIIESGRKNFLPSRIFDRAIATLIVLSVSVVFVMVFDFSQSVLDVFIWLERIASVVFTIEYIFRIWTADLKCPTPLPFA